MSAERSVEKDAADGPVLNQLQEWAIALRDDLAAYSRDQDPERRSISANFMLVRLRPALDMLEVPR